MASLSRWSKPIAPTWLGNDKDPHPFTMQFKRLTQGELKDFAARLEEIQRSGSGATAEDVVSLYQRAVRGPLRHADLPSGPALTIDDVAIPEGDLGGLVKAGLEEGPRVQGRIIQELTDLLFRENGLSVALEGESLGSHGGASTTRADRAEAPTPAPSASA